VQSRVNAEPVRRTSRCHHRAAIVEAEADHLHLNIFKGDSSAREETRRNSFAFFMELHTLRPLEPGAVAVLSKHQGLKEGLQTYSLVPPTILNAF
jgi:hypothetical protein